MSSGSHCLIMSLLLCDDLCFGTVTHLHAPLCRLEGEWHSARRVQVDAPLAARCCYGYCAVTQCVCACVRVNSDSEKTTEATLVGGHVQLFTNSIPLHTLRALRTVKLKICYSCARPRATMHSIGVGNRVDIGLERASVHVESLL